MLKCPPGPLGHRKGCHKGGGTSTSDSGSGENGNGNGDGDGNGDDYGNGDEGSGSNYQSANVADGSYTNNNSTTSEKNALQSFFTSRYGHITLIVISALAASIAIAAMYMNHRNRNSNNTIATDNANHPLSGVLSKRIGLFQRLADRTYCGSGGCRPEAMVVEDQVVMGNSNGSGSGSGSGSGNNDYRLV